MTRETKAKWTVRWLKAKDFIHRNGGWIFAGATTFAAWRGYEKSKQNSRRIRTLFQRTEVLKDVVNNNADCQMRDRERMLELERQQNLLFEQALKETEGKAE